MKNLNPIKFVPLLISIVSVGCAGSGGESVINTMDSGLASVGRAAVTGRAVIEAGSPAAAGVPVSQTSLTNVLVSQLGVSHYPQLLRCWEVQAVPSTL